MLENYCKVIKIEALTMLQMARRDIVPAAAKFIREISETAISKKSFLPSIDCSVEEKLVSQANELLGVCYAQIEALDKALSEVDSIKDAEQQAMFDHSCVCTIMEKMREAVDTLETIVGAEYWPYPTYEEILFSVR